MAEGGYIREYLVGLGFEVDEAGLAAFRNAIETAKQQAQALSELPAPVSFLQDVKAESAFSGLREQARQAARDASAALRQGLSQQDVLSGLRASLGDTASEASGAFSSFPGRVRTLFQRARSLAEGAMNPLPGRMQAIAQRAGSAFDGLPAQVGAAFSSAASAAVQAFSAAVEGIAAQSRQIQASVAAAASAAGSLNAQGVTAAANTPVLQNADGGVYDVPALTTISEGGAREYVIPVEKPQRAAPLLRAAMADLGAMAPALPAYAGGAVAQEMLVQAGATTHNTRVEAPVTMNVYGTDAPATAHAVSRLLSRRLSHNARGRIRI